MRLLTSALALALMAATLVACQDDPANTDAEEVAVLNSERGGTALVFPDSSELGIEVIAQLTSGFPECQVELIPDSFSYGPGEYMQDDARRNDQFDDTLTIFALGDEDDLARLAECAAGRGR